ncbi:MAG TPA: sugar-binding protein [Stellaceae bacterium]|nr:sugar-binding protein [Stellaceae bacterium]
MRHLMFAAAALGLLATPAAAQTKQYTFALVPKAMNNPFFDLARDGCMKAAADLNVKCLYIGPGEHTETEQVQIVQDLISKGVDGIAVSPSNAAAMARTLKAAKDSGIATITWDSDVPPQDKAVRLAYIGTKNYDIGVNLAKLVQARKPNGGTICLQSGGAAAENHNERLQGIRDTLAGATGTKPPGKRLAGDKGWTEVEGCPLFTNDDSAVAVQQMADIVNKYGDLDAYISTGAFTQWSDNAYRQAVQPQAARLKSGKFVVVMADTLAMQMGQLKDGLSDGQVGQRPYQMGYLAMEKLLDVKNGKTLPDPIYTGLDVCTPENAASCLGQK